MSFNMRHWAWLARNGHIEAPPMDLAPFPFAVMTDTEENQLHEDLKRWGYLQEGVLTDDARYLLDAIAHTNVLTIRGLVLLYSKKTNAVKEFDTKDDEFDLIKAVRDIPRVPFTITVTDSEIITAINTLPALMVTRHQRRGDIATQVGPILKTILDPKDEWEPWQSTPVTIPFGVAQDIVNDKELSEIIFDEDKVFNDGEDSDDTATIVRDTHSDARRKKQAKGTQQLLSRAEVPAYTAEKLGNLVGQRTIQTVILAITYSTVQGVVEPDASTGIMYFEEAGTVVSYAKGRSPETRSIRYVPGDDQGFIEGVRALINLADPPKRR